MNTTARLGAACGALLTAVVVYATEPACCKPNDIVQWPGTGTPCTGYDVTVCEAAPQAGTQGIFSTIPRRATCTLYMSLTQVVQHKCAFPTPPGWTKLGRLGGDGTLCCYALNPTSGVYLQGFDIYPCVGECVE